MAYMHKDLWQVLDDNEFRLLSKLGEGGFGEVFLMEKHSGPNRGKLYACKVSSCTRMVGHEPSEVRILSRKLDQEPFFVKQHGCYAIHNHSLIAFEYCNGGDLDSFNRRQIKSGYNFPPVFLWHIFLSAARALDSAHQCGVIHRDVKPANLLLHYSEENKSGAKFPEVKLTDWGVSAVTTDMWYSPYSRSGTPEFKPQDIPYLADEKCDVWALGATIHALMFRDRMPGQGPHKYDERYERALYDLMGLCLLPHKDRISSKELRRNLEIFAPQRIDDYYNKKRCQPKKILKRATI